METPDLPEGMRPEDLRFVHPQNFPIYMSMRGWSAEAHFDVDNMPAKSRIVLIRPLDTDFGINDFAELIEKMGIAGDEPGTFKEGYDLRVDSFDEIASFSKNLSATINPHIDYSRCLYFEFEGYSDTETMEVLEAITSHFERPEVVVKQRWLRRMLGKISSKG